MNYLDINKSLWDEKTNHHLHSDFYQQEAFMNGATSLQSIELDALKDRVAGKKLLHLQCHFGQDTLSWARLGAKVTGIDLSSKAIEVARSLNDQLGLDATFVQSDVYSLPDNLEEKFDIIFTSYGTITWLPDLDKWANVIQHFLKPGGTFYMAEFHPTMYMYDTETHKIAYRYFGHKDPYVETVQGTYADTKADIEHQEIFWCHSLSETIQSLLTAGLQLKTFKEFDFSPYNCFPNMKEVAPGQYVYGDLENRMPHVFSIEMRR